jgi:hypothetical protein
MIIYHCTITFRILETNEMTHPFKFNNSILRKFSQGGAYSLKYYIVAFGRVFHVARVHKGVHPKILIGQRSNFFLYLGPGHYRVRSQ